MNKARYYQFADDNIKRLKNGRLEYFGNNTKGWAPSRYPALDVKANSSFKRITRDEARKQFPKAFRA